PFFFGSSLAGPGSSGQASLASTMPSLSRSGGGGQPFFFGSELAGPGSSGQAALAATMPALSRAGGGGGGAAFFWAGVYASMATARRSGVPMPEVSPGPAPAPISKSSTMR